MIDRSAILQAAASRQTPLFAICDESTTMLYASPGVEALGLTVTRLKALAAGCRASLETPAGRIVELDERTAVRIVSLGRTLPGCFALFFEVLMRRDPISAAVQRFGLTKRETDVLKLLMKNESSSQMARSLCVAECTIADHVKSIMRKFNVSKRAAIHTKVFAAETAGLAGSMSLAG